GDDVAHVAVVVLRHLGPYGLSGDKRDDSPAGKQGRSDTVRIAHRLHVLLILFLRPMGPFTCSVPRAIANKRAEYGLNGLRSAAAELPQIFVVGRKHD